ncbi:hypothetical protein [Mycobacterium kyogaense]|uniref:hypothetical protein n=1 Tax=Mycobacterium kyogaense TaxID=2212479 RepID=UPI000DAF08C1|nr:hypothetical protein [Mycobacterium kyogaense]
MVYVDTYFSAQDRYSLGIEDNSCKAYLSIPVSSGVVDYEEYYELAADEYCELLQNRSKAAEFAESCRNRDRDGRLIERPGWNRGTPV